MRKAAVVCARGIGDGLLMMVASHRLVHAQYEVTTYHDSLSELSDWFPLHMFEKHPDITELKEVFLSYSLIILENDNSERAQILIDLYKKGILRNLSVFYPTYEKEKHAHLTSWDRVFSENLSMVTNISIAISSLLQSREISTNNGIVPPDTLSHRKHLYRVAIHPTGSKQSGMWKKEHFLEVARTLTKRGFLIAFCVSVDERPLWEDVTAEGFLLPIFPTLGDTAAFLYESGYVIGNDSSIAHLASNLQIPTIVVSNCYKRMRLWRPGWLKGAVLTPARWIPNFKGLRLRERKWQSFITPRKVFSNFKLLAIKDNLKL